MTEETEEYWLPESVALQHIGIKRRSGRYPWGSGNNPYQRSQSFKSYLDEMRAGGMSNTDIARAIESLGKQSDPHFKFNTTDLRAAISSSTDIIRGENIAAAQRMAYGPDGNRKMSNTAIAKKMGTGEATVRGWLKQAEEGRVSSIEATAAQLRDAVSKKQFVDVGKGEWLYMGVSESKLKQALATLRDEGYALHQVKVPQLGTDKMTNVKVLADKGVSWHDAREAIRNGQLSIMTAQSDDGGLTFRTPKGLPNMVDSKRIAIKYDEDGGTQMDGVIELRRGVADLDLGAARYAQVRVAVDGTHYLKGMAIYADDLPKGVDIRFNTNKKLSDVGPDKLAVMKEMNMVDGKVDERNPFGSSTYPHSYIDKNGKEVNSSLNIVGTKGRGNIEGRWDQWSSNFSSQMLSKQPISLVKDQLGVTAKAQKEELDKIMKLTNPVVRQKLLEEFADSADAAAVHLKAASLPRTSTHVLLPMNNMKPNEIYAPNYRDGDQVALVRHPHGGPFEIPILTVNNRSHIAKRVLSNAQDAVGIHHSVAEQLSGADFDGDTVLVIPTTGQIKNRPPLQQLKGFDPKTEYREVPGMQYMKSADGKKDNTQLEMGKISNLITDMTIKGANDDEIARAVRHSMVVIDAAKHKLNYKQSEKDNNIAQLKRDYQGAANAGKATLISKAGSTQRVPQRKYLTGKQGIDPVTGERVYVETGKKRSDGSDVMTKGTVMEFTKDAYTLSSGRPVEDVYAGYANSMKAMANQARLESIRLSMPKQSTAAKAVYKDEVSSLEVKLKTAQRNAPLERRAQVIGNALARSRIDANPQYDKDDIKKAKYEALDEARTITGANKLKVYVEDREWEAIQAGAVSASRLREILSNADMDRVKDLATPRYRSSLTPGQIARAKAMAASGKPYSEIADSLGIPRSTIIDNINNA